MLRTAGEQFNNLMAAHAHQCPLLYNRTGQTLASHLAIIGRLLDMKDNDGKRGGTSNDLLAHIVATSYAKMNRRLRQPVSTFFINSLKSVAPGTFDEGKRDTAKADEKAQKEQNREIENDKLFVTEYFLPTADQTRKDSFPALMRQAQLVADGKDTKLYTKESHLEFHGMLLVLIADFMESLGALLTLRDPVRLKKNPPNPPIKRSDAFERTVAKAILDGYALQRLAKGLALKMHLQNITPALQSWNYRNSSTPVLTEEERQERDEDIEAVHESVQNGVQNGAVLVTSYLDWFRLMISHFDAVDILIQYVTKYPIGSISIDILLPPFVDKKLLNWQLLFSDPKLFPAQAVLGNEGKSATNPEILTFLTEALTMLPTIKAAQEAWNMGNRDHTTNCLKTLKTSNVTSWVKCAENILVKLENNNSLDEEIDAEIDSFSRSTQFFDALAKPHFELTFSGTLHCEACLASLIADSSLANGDLLAKMKVSQVSDLFLLSESHLL